MSEFNDTLERISMQLEQIEESLPRRPLWKRRLLEDLLSGAARGIGFSIGFTVLGALLLYVLQSIALANLPIIGKFQCAPVLPEIGKFLAELVRIVESNL